MQRYVEAVNELQKDRVYSRRDIINQLKNTQNLSDNSCSWIFGSLVRDGSVVRLGRDRYSITPSSPRSTYVPGYSDMAQSLSGVIDGEYPHVKFAVFETSLLNEFLNHLIAQNTIFIQVEKESSIFIFRFLQNLGYANVMYKPDRRDFELYWSKNCIVITNLVSEAPLGGVQHSVTLEKMLVDMVSDKLISTTYSASELGSVIQEAGEKYTLDKVRLLRYARRRGREDEMKRYLALSNC